MPGVLRGTRGHAVAFVNEDRAFNVGAPAANNLLPPIDSQFDPMRTHRRSAFTLYPGEVLVEEPRFIMDKARFLRETSTPRGVHRDYEDVRVNRRYRRPSSFGAQTEETFDVSLGPESDA